MAPDETKDDSEEQAERPSESTLIAERRAKAERLREAGRDPFPHSFPDRTCLLYTSDAADE